MLGQVFLGVLVPCCVISVVMWSCLAFDLPAWTALIALAHIKGFPYYVDMNITLSLDDELVKKVRKIAVERDTTLTGIVRDYLEQLANENAASGRKRRERDALERSFEQFQFQVGKRTWKRADLHARS
jgi:predicted transcriptional regulator